MKKSVFLMVASILFVLVFILSACASPTDGLPGTGSQGTQPPGQTTPAGPVGTQPVETSEPSTKSEATSGTADFIAALQVAGAEVEPEREISQPFFNAPGQVLRVNGGEVQVFEYENEAARQSDSATISPDGSTIGGANINWVENPNIWAAGRLIVLYLGSDADTIELFNGILGDRVAGRKVR